MAGFFDRIDEQPAEVVELEEDTATRRHVQDQQRTEQQLESIAAQIRAGRLPELVLYNALQLIGELTGRTQWAADLQGELDRVYKDLQQESLFIDRAAVSDQRRRDQRKTYTEKTRRQLERSLKGCERLQSALQQALLEVQALEPSDDGTIK